MTAYRDGDLERCPNCGRVVAQGVGHIDGDPARVRLAWRPGWRPRGGVIRYRRDRMGAKGKARVWMLPASVECPCGARWDIDDGYRLG